MGCLADRLPKVCCLIPGSRPPPIADVVRKSQGLSWMNRGDCEAEMLSMTLLG